SALDGASGSLRRMRQLMASTKATSANHPQGSQLFSWLDATDASSSAHSSTGIGARCPCRASSCSSASASVGEALTGATMASDFMQTCSGRSGGSSIAEETELVDAIHRLRARGNAQRLVHRKEVG